MFVGMKCSRSPLKDGVWAGQMADGSHKECQPRCHSRSSGLTREQLGLDRGMAVNCYFLSMQRNRDRVLERKKCSLGLMQQPLEKQIEGG